MTAEGPLDPVEESCVLQAWWRAGEARRPDALFDDPVARTVAERMVEAAVRNRFLASAMDAVGREIHVRSTAAVDGALAAWSRGIEAPQIVTLGAGLDARPVRLDWPDGTRFFQVDTPRVLAHARRLVGGPVAWVPANAARPAVLLGALAAGGCDLRRPVAVVLEGLVEFLGERRTADLLEAVRDAAAPGSTIVAQVLDPRFLAVAAERGGGVPWRRLPEPGSVRAALAPWPVADLLADPAPRTDAPAIGGLVHVFHASCPSRAVDCRRGGSPAERRSDTARPEEVSVMRVSDYIADTLHRSGIDQVYEVAGGMIAPLLDSFGRHQGIRVVTVHHEQSGAFAVDAHGRLTGRPAVALGTAGPGALNLLTGIASCYCDSVPALFIGGHVQTYLQRKNRPIRQFGLQETSFAEAAAPVAKAVFKLTRAADAPQVVADAFAAATGGRPGPVVIEIPFDVQGAALDAEPADLAPPAPAEPPAGSVAAALDLLHAAERPLIHVGAGVRRAGAVDALGALLRTVSVPVTTSILGKDALPADAPLNLGMPGTYGVRAANLAMAEADAVLVLGSRLDQGQIGADPVSWKRGKQVAQVDCDAGELAARLRGALAIECDAGSFLAAALEQAGTRKWPARTSWLDRVAALVRDNRDVDELEGCPGINPNAFMRALSAASSAAAAYVVDAGQHTWWAAQSIRLTGDQRFVASTGLWSMGVALPNAIGAALATGGPVVAIVGDGAAQMNLQELQTIVRNRLPVKIVVVNNGCLGMVRQFQDAAMGGRHYSTVIGYDTPDFLAVASGYGIPAHRVAEPDEVAAGVDRMWRDRGPSLLEVHVDAALPVMPQVGFGKPLNVMESYVPAQREPEPA